MDLGREIELCVEGYFCVPYLDVQMSVMSGWVFIQTGRVVRAENLCKSFVYLFI